MTGEIGINHSDRAVKHLRRSDIWDQGRTHIYPYNPYLNVEGAFIYELTSC